MHLATRLHKTLEEIMALSTDEIILWAAFLDMKNGK